ncbi:MAG: YbhB/YbcL family Raf kinase inhibitor-like protein [Deltaproteobacteria bacterium]
MTSLKFRTGPAWLVALAIAPWLVGSACSDDDSAPNDGPLGGSGGTAGTAGAGGGAGNVGISGAGGTGGASGSGGSAGANSSAGSGGGMNPDAGPEQDGGGTDASTQAFTLTSTAVDDVPGCGPADNAEDLCDLFPADNTGLNGARNVSPQLDWTGAPTGTQSFAIALHDLSNLNGQDPFTHWVMWNIPGSATGLPAELPEGLEPGVPDDDTRQVSFRGNNAFAGSGAPGNVYEFVLFALGTAAIDPGSEDPDTVEGAIAGSSDVLGTATLRARSTP